LLFLGFKKLNGENASFPEHQLLKLLWIILFLGFKKLNGENATFPNIYFIKSLWIRLLGWQKKIFNLCDFFPFFRPIPPPKAPLSPSKLA
jgi:hypothetical protein